MPEYLDIYDEAGNPTGAQCIRGDRLPPGQYVKVVHVFIVNERGEFLIQQRALCKKIWPGQWAILGGFVSAGESTRQTVLREVEEEIGIRLRAQQTQRIQQIKRTESGVIMEYWYARAEIALEDCVLQPGEVEAVGYVSGQALYDLYAHSDRWTDADAPYIRRVLDIIRQVDAMQQQPEA